MSVIQRHPDLVIPKPLTTEMTVPTAAEVKEQPDRQIPDQSSDDIIPAERNQPSDEPSSMAKIPDLASPSQQAPVGFAPRKPSPQRHSRLTRQRCQPQRYGDIRRFSDYKDFE